MTQNANIFAQIGEDVKIWPLAKVVNTANIFLGNNIIVDDFCLLISGSRLKIGDFVHIAAYVLVTGGGDFEMGSFSGISAGTRIFTGNEDYSGNYLTNPTVPFPFRQPIRSFVRIEKHAIVGANSTVLPGVTIGEGAVVGAHSLVKRDCKPWTIYAGCPAKVIGKRRSDRIIKLEAELTKEAYDEKGLYIPSSERSKTIT